MADQEDEDRMDEDEEYQEGNGKKMKTKSAGKHSKKEKMIHTFQNHVWPALLDLGWTKVSFTVVLLPEATCALGVIKN